MCIRDRFPCLYFINTLSTTLPSDRAKRYFWVPSSFEVCTSKGSSAVSTHAVSYTHLPNLDRTLRLIREKGCKAGVAINPATSVQVLENVLEIVDMVLIMTVNPGFGGQAYIPYCANKVRQIREMAKGRNLTLDIQVDGGINKDTISEVLELSLIHI